MISSWVLQAVDCQRGSVGFFGVCEHQRMGPWGQGWWYFQESDQQSVSFRVGVLCAVMGSGILEANGMRVGVI